MATSEALKLARIQAKIARQRSDLELAKAVISNPVVELVAGIVAISYLNKGSQSWLESVSGIDLAAGGQYAGLVAIIGLQQIAPSLPALYQAQGEFGAGLAKALPALIPLLAAV